MQPECALFVYVSLQPLASSSDSTNWAWQTCVRAARSINERVPRLWEKNRISLRIIWLHVWETFIANWRLLGRTRCWKQRRLSVIYTRQPWLFSLWYAHWNHRRAITFCHPYWSCSLGAADALSDWLLNAGSVCASRGNYVFYDKLCDELWASIWESFTQIAPLINTRMLPVG
jgi:hypothetical protein